MIEIKKLTKEFATPRGKITVLKDFSLNVKEGTFLGVSGKSGAGKSTLLSLIAGLQKADSGEILIDGKNILSLNDKDLCAFRNKNIGFISQEQSFLENLTVLDNVRLPVFLGGWKVKSENGSGSIPGGNAPSARALSLLESLGIANLAKSFPSELSGGENHRVLIARALMNDPQVILADEATESVDSERTEQIVAIFKKLADQGKTVIFVSHNKSALKDCNQQIVIDY